MRRRLLLSMVALVALPKTTLVNAQAPGEEKIYIGVMKFVTSMLAPIMALSDRIDRIRMIIYLRDLSDSFESVSAAKRAIISELFKSKSTASLSPLIAQLQERILLAQTKMTALTTPLREQFSKEASRLAEELPEIFNSRKAWVTQLQGQTKSLSDASIKDLVNASKASTAALNQLCETLTQMINKLKT